MYLIFIAGFSYLYGDSDYSSAKTSIEKYNSASVGWYFYLFSRRILYVSDVPIFHFICDRLNRYRRFISRWRVDMVLITPGDMSDELSARCTSARRHRFNKPSSMPWCAELGGASVRLCDELEASSST